MEKEHLEMILEDINSKFDLILEGHEGLRDAIRDLDQKTDKRFDEVDFKIETVGNSLNEHRRDTEAHRGYQVRED